jgi:hypothetical protein
MRCGRDMSNIAMTDRLKETNKTTLSSTVG